MISGEGQQACRLQEQAKRRRSQAVLDDLRGKSGNMDARQVDAALRRQLGHLGLVRDRSLGLVWLGLAHVSI